MNPPTEPRAHCERASPLSPKAWQDEQLFCQADDYFTQLIAAIDGAHSSVTLEFYIFNHDPLGQRIITALINAASRHVTVRVLFDAIGSSESGEHAAQELEAAGIRVKIFHPLPWQLGHYHRALTQGSFVDKLIHFSRSMNRRDHRKLCVIDSVELWSGSLNISQKHLSLESGGEGWRDYGIKVTGSAVKAVEENFDALWLQQKPRFMQGLFRYYWNNLSNNARKRKNRLLVEKINHAKQRIWIVSAYFAPSSAVIRALKAAASRHVDVRILVSQRSDVVLFPSLTSSYYVDLLNIGIRVFEYLPSILHAKALIIDQFYLVGSTNFNHRSFLHDLELDIVLKKTASQQQLETFFMDDLDHSQEVQQENIRHYRLLGWIARLLRYWM